LNGALAVKLKSVYITSKKNPVIFVWLGNFLTLELQRQLEQDQGKLSDVFSKSAP
jgi:hypothetical protein